MPNIALITCVNAVTKKVAIFCFVGMLLFTLTARPAHAADGFFQNIWCGLISIVGLSCDDELTESVVELVPEEEESISPPAKAAQESAPTVSKPTEIIRETPTYVTNEYVTNPTTIIRETVREGSGGGGSRVDTSNLVSLNLFNAQTDATYDSIDDSLGGLSDSLSESVDTELLTVSGNTSLTALNVSGAVSLSAVAGGVLIADANGLISTTTVAEIGITDNSINFNKLSNTLTVDASTTFDLDSNNADLTFDSGTLFIDSSSNRHWNNESYKCLEPYCRWYSSPSVSNLYRVCGDSERKRRM